jgi:hypothetical protein
MAARNGRISLSIYDRNGGSGNFLTHVSVDDAQTIAQAYTALATVSTLYATVADGGIKEASFSLVNRAVAADPASDANVGVGAVVDFNNAADPTINGVWIPSFLDTLLGPGRDIDLSSGATAAFVTAMIGAILGGHYTNGAGIANAAATRAFRTNRKLR